MSSRTLVHFLKGAAEANPDGEAIVQGTRRVHYKHLWKSVCQLSNFLREKGLQSKDRIGILSANSVEYVVSYYGALAAGGVAVSLNNSAKAHDLENWLRHSGATWIFAAPNHPELGRLMELMPEINLVLLPGPCKQELLSTATSNWDTICECSSDEPSLDEIILDVQQEASIIYTSGTTGDPKGVTLSHRNLAANTQSILTYLNLSSSDRIVNVLPFFYSYGNSILHTHIAVGGTIILENSLLYPHKVLETVSKERSTGFSGVPSTYALLLSRTKLEEFDLTSLRYITQAGGPMPPANITRLKKVLPNVEIVIMYGQTEATARLSYLPSDQLEAKLGSCGIGIPGVTLEVRDKDGKRVPDGVVGEIYAHGENIMLRYWENPEATKKAVIDGWLKTGDLAYADSDGYLFITGRSSEMIKSGGQRISPKEIEEIISELDAVAEVGVIGIPDEMLGQIIQAYIQIKPGANLKVKEVQSHCVTKLAAYKVPKFIQFIDSDLPRTASGKLRRYLLQEKFEKDQDGIRDKTTQTA